MIITLCFHDFSYICVQFVAKQGRAQHIPAKGIAAGFPLSAFTAKPEIADAFTVGSHLSTFGGNPVSCAAAIANIDIMLEELTTEWHLMADLYALSVQMDRVRFGSITFLAAGERIRLVGDYDYDGRKIFEFNDPKQLNASGDQGCSHEWWHKFSEKKKNEQLRAHAHMKMREVAYFLNRLDSEKELFGPYI